MKLLCVSAFAIKITTANAPVHGPYCDVERDDIRFFGSGGDAGRVELCHESTWRYVCADPKQWSMETATVACRQLGYQSAFMAKPASLMAFGETVDSGVKDAGIFLRHCQGDEQSLRNCELDYSSVDCTIHQTVGAACSTSASNSASSTYPSVLKEKVRNYITDMETLFFSDKVRREQQWGNLTSETDDVIEVTAENIVRMTPTEMKGIPAPFEDVEAINEAYVFPEAATKTFEKIQADFTKSIINVETSPMKLLQDAGTQIHWSPFGLDFSPMFTPPMTLTQVKSVLEKSPLVETVRDLYLSANQHNALHWHLDAPYRYYTEPDENISSDPVARKIFDTLQQDGIVLIDDFGGNIDDIIRLADESLSNDSLYLKNETSIAGGGSILTSRREISPLAEILIHNQTLASVINAYQGPSILHGYKVTRLTTDLKTTDQYNAGMYHHDRVGRRIKLFVFLHDVDCEMGHPTRVAVGSHKLHYYKTEDYPMTRFTNDCVEQNFEIRKGCGKRGGGFLFDTHTLHKGTVEGDRERTVVIAEYHHIAKCAYTKKHNLGIPCPGGDIYRADAPLSM